MDKISALINEMIIYECGCINRINHFLKVHSFAKLIAEMENIDDRTKFLIQTAAVVHDIGIKPSMEKYHSSAGKYQQLEGVYPAKKILEKLCFDTDIIDRVCYLIAHHHTYSNIDGIDYQILVEADFLVNIFEENMTKEKAVSVVEKYFKTGSSKLLFENIYSNFL